MTPEQLVEIPGIGEKMVEKIHQSVAAHFEALEAAAAAPAEEVILPEEGVLEAEAVEEAGTEATLEGAAVEETPEEAVAEGDQEAAEESAEAADLTDVTAAEEAASEAAAPGEVVEGESEAETEESGEPAES
jgi:Holliday junction resolvasome RuvABC DNA-binding subunit